jgi:hypothetical protein
MAETKYKKYRLNELAPEQRYQGFGRWPQTILFTDNDIIKGSKHFWASWVTSLPLPAHGPHTHNDDEMLVMLGSDPNNIKDLGCEVELCMGPEMEKHIIKESTLVYVPANLVHCPIKFRNLKRPFIFIQAQRAPKLTEKPRRELVPPQERNKMVFFDFDGTQTDEDVQKEYRKIQETTNRLKESQGDTASVPGAEPVKAGADTKYGKYFLHYCSPEKRQHKFGRLPQTVIFTDDDVIKGSHQFWVLWITSLPWPEHGPHSHTDSESMVTMGTDPNDPQDAGLETEDYMGLEMEKYVTTRSSLIFMPAGFVHGPIRYRKFRRPFIMVQCHYAPRLTEKSYKKMAAEAERDKLVFFDLDGSETDKDLQKQRGGRAGAEDVTK